MFKFKTEITLLGCLYVAFVVLTLLGLAFTQYLLIAKLWMLSGNEARVVIAQYIGVAWGGHWLIGKMFAPMSVPKEVTKD